MKYRPEVLIPGLSVVYVVMGDKIDLHCNFKANPAVSAKVTWYRNGESLDVESLQITKVTQDGAEISIDNGKISRLVFCQRPLRCFR